MYIYKNLFSLSTQGYVVWSLFQMYARTCEIAKALNFTFSAVWRLVLSEGKMKECAEINKFL